MYIHRGMQLPSLVKEQILPYPGCECRIDYEAQRDLQIVDQFCLNLTCSSTEGSRSRTFYCASSTEKESALVKTRDQALKISPPIQKGRNENICKKFKWTVEESINLIENASKNSKRHYSRDEDLMLIQLVSESQRLRWKGVAKDYPNERSLHSLYARYVRLYKEDQFKNDAIREQFIRYPRPGWVSQRNPSGWLILDNSTG